MATADSLLSSIKARCFWPTSGTCPLTDAEILSFADAEIVGTLWPLVLATQGDYYIDTLDYDITVDVVRYRLPKSSYGPIKDIVYVNSDDDETSVPLVNLEEVGHYQVRNSESRYVSFIEGDFVGLLPTPSSTTGTLRIRYYRHPNALCLVASAKQITAADLTTGVLSASSPNSLWTTSSTLCVIGSGNAHQVLAEDLDVSSIGGASVTVSNDLEGSGIEAGDWLATTGQTPLVQVPDSMVPLLTYRTALACLSADGDKDGFGIVLEWGRQAQLEEKQVKLLEPRSESEPRAISTRNSTLWLGSTRGRSSWR